MSVLLEALKKAAEDKKQSDDSADSSSQSVNLTSEKVELQPQVDTLSLDEPLGTSEPKPTEPLSSIKLTTEPELPATEKPLSIDELDISESSEPDVRIESSTDKADLDNQGESKINPLQQLEPESQDVVVPVEETDPKLDSLEPLTPSSSDSTPDTQKKESDDSFDWSLNTLPGYTSIETNEQPSPQSDKALDEAQSSNQILSTSKRFSKSGPAGSIRQFIFGGSSNIAIYLLFSFFTVTVVGFFSIYYFQQQSEQLDQSMRKYKLVRTVLPTQVDATATPINNQTIKDETVQQTEPVADEKVDIADFSDSVGGRPEIEKAENSNNEPETPVGSIATEAKPKNSTTKVPTKTDRDVKQNSRLVSKSSELTITAINQESNMQLAYAALYEDNLDQAQQLFNQILEVEPENISALNGIASVYAQTSDEQSAVNAYQHVLSISPNNLHAFEALVSLLGDALNSDEWKSEIMRVLETNPESAVLNYAIGNIYASQQDWKMAQEYYFNASAIEQTNSDYLVNLAVSLDHLGQYELAEQNYTSALVHAGSQPVSFDEKQIKQRLITIRQFIGTRGK